MITTPAGWIPMGQAYWEDKMSAAVELTDTPDQGDALPSTANCAIIIITTQPAHYKNDGAGATTNHPQYPKDLPLVIDNGRDTLVNASFLESAASSRLSAWWFRSPSG